MRRAPQPIESANCPIFNTLPLNHDPTILCRQFLPKVLILGASQTGGGGGRARFPELSQGPECQTPASETRINQGGRIKIVLCWPVPQRWGRPGFDGDACG